MQKIINGIANLPAILKEVGCKKLFLVIDSSYPFLNIKDAIEALPVEEKVKFSDFTPNPLYEQVCNGIDLLKSSNCDTILAVGGGSAIDVAKCIQLAVLAKEGKAAVVPPLVSQRLPIDGSRIPFIAIPTTAGTGSESTHNAVMYYEGAKQTVTNDGVLPDYAVLEPSVLKTLPLYQKKCTMMDALCQGIESWWSINSTDESKVYSRKTVELIMANWRKYIFDNDEVAAAQIMLAANYGGRAINITQTTAPHAMSYKITSMYKLPHGHAVAVCLPEVWQYMLDHPEKCRDERGVAYLADIFTEISCSMGFNTPELAIMGFREILHELGLALPVPGKNRSEELQLLAASVNPIRLKNNPCYVDVEDAQWLYDRILITQTRHLQLVILGIMKGIDALCRKNDITYYLLGGSAIGAVRHQGFIPWDDDLDIVMSPDNYERFIKVCRTQLDTTKYYFQEGFKDWPLGFSKIRLKGTAVKENGGFSCGDDKDGIYVDVFKMENSPRGRFAQWMQYIAAKYYLCYQLAERGYDGASTKQRIMIALSFPLRWAALRRRLKAYIEGFKDDSMFFGSFYFRTRIKTAFTAKSVFGQPKLHQFEDTMLPIPEHVDEYLTQMFGDYMIPPPPEKQVGLHMLEVDFGQY